MAWPRQRGRLFISVFELHRRGIHHGDIRPQNFGVKTGSKRKNSESDPHPIVVCDFFHSSFFEDCDPEQCQKLQWARKSILDLFYP